MLGQRGSADFFFGSRAVSLRCTQRRSARASGRTWVGGLPCRRPRRSARGLQRALASRAGPWSAPIRARNWLGPAHICKMTCRALDESPRWGRVKMGQRHILRARAWGHRSCFGMGAVPQRVSSRVCVNRATSHHFDILKFLKGGRFSGGVGLGTRGLHVAGVASGSTALHLHLARLLPTWLWPTTISCALRRARSQFLTHSVTRPNNPEPNFR